MRDRVGRTWKLVVAVAAFVATLSFFQPFIEMRYDRAMVPISAYRILFGFDDIGDIDPALRDLPPEVRERQLAQWNDTIQHETAMVWSKKQPQPSRIPYYYLSAAALLLVGAVALARRQLGFWGALCTVGAGLCAVWGWSRELLIDRHMVADGDLTSHIAGGATLLGVAGAIALLGGIGALVCADPGGFRARRMISVQLDRGEPLVKIEVPTETPNIPRAVVKRAQARSAAEK